MFGRKLKLNVVQVEVSTKCQLNCVMCPKYVFSNEWIHENMDLDVIKSVPFEAFDYAHLQGWGEPLLNDDLPEMIDIAKKYCKVGLTTNGLLLDEYVDTLSKLDLLAISIGSADPDVHRSVRRSKLEKILDNVKLLSERKDKPKIVFNTLMMKNTVKQLPELVKLAFECGADEVIANNLDYIPAEYLFQFKVFSSDDAKEYVHEASVLAEKLGIKFVARPLKLEEALVCAENPIKNCLITWDGKITPCVYLHLPTKSESIKRYFEGKSYDVKKLYFGTVFEGFTKVWRKKEYTRFRAIFEERLRSTFGFELKIPKLPTSCRTCYKAYSI